MPLLTPQNDNVRDVLREAGLIPRSAGDKVRLSDILTEKGFGVEEIADSIIANARSAEKEEIRYKYNELALKIHGELKDKDAKQVPNIVFVGADQSTLNVLIPRG